MFIYLFQQIDFTFATTKIKLPFCHYATRLYEIYQDFIEGRIIEGTMITVNGIIKQPIKNDSELPLLEDRSGFTMIISMFQNDTMTFYMLFQRETKQVNCYDKVFILD